MIDYIVRVIASAVFGAVAYIGLWLLLGLAWRWGAMGGEALLSVVALHITTLHKRVWQEVL